MTARFCDLPDGPAPVDVLSASTAKLVLRSPRHAWLSKRGMLAGRGDAERAEDPRHIGTVLHSALLNRGKLPVPIPFDSYQSGGARRAAALIREMGGLPVLRPVFDRIVATAGRAVANMAEFGIVFAGVSEQGIEWTETADVPDAAHSCERGGQAHNGSEMCAACLGQSVECCGRLDHFVAGGLTATIYDLKTCRSAHPDACRRQIAGFGGDIQAAAYTSAVSKVMPAFAGRIRFVFVFVEVGSGIVTPVTLTGEFRALGERRWRRAVNVWARCLRTNEWPAYVTAPVAVEPPGWALVEEEDAALDDEQENGDEG